MGIECSDIQVYRDDFADKNRNPVVFTGDKESARNFIGNFAFQHNGGRYEFYYDKCHKHYCYDCGDALFYTTQKIDLEAKHEADFTVNFSK